MKTILLTGAGGFVGARIARRLEVVPAPSLRDMDERAVRTMVDQIGPDAIVHTAAISDIGACERDSEASHRANVEIPLWLASKYSLSELFRQLAFNTSTIIAYSIT